MISEMYVFETINNQECVRYKGVYNTDGSFNFTKNPYFTMIQTDYNDGSYSNVQTFYGDDVITKWDIGDMLYYQGIKVDLVVKGKETADLILPLIKIDDDYAYFSNDELSLTVDVNGAVAVEEPNGGK